MNSVNPFWWIYTKHTNIDIKRELLSHELEQLNKSVKYARGLIEFSRLRDEINKVKIELKRINQLKREKRYKIIRKVIPFLLVGLSGFLVYVINKDKYRQDDVDVVSE
ncbi:hypothetical protein BUZ51_06200 [Staphylococcus hominis]|uniref:Uncharacterized protein n=2 Tax=Staphylococcus hominis TaxID=1290 RepID=A0A974QND0_STAHO|nr:hypothetical protein [Staphylococcus hominis]PTK30805.1 hypothetical protein BUZ51_06200 [Staphylococcus hominis]